MSWYAKVIWDTLLRAMNLMTRGTPINRDDAILRKANEVKDSSEAKVAKKAKVASI